MGVKITMETSQVHLEPNLQNGKMLQSHCTSKGTWPTATRLAVLGDIRLFVAADMSGQ